jgi:PiT family inorganic phosphate transporter
MTPEEIETKTSENYFVPLLIMSALSVACAHGGNDVGNAVGPLSAIIMVQDSGKVSSKPDIPFWALCYGSIGFVIGIVTMGSLTIKTVGTKITTLKHI